MFVHDVTVLQCAAVFCHVWQGDGNFASTIAIPVHDVTVLQCVLQRVAVCGSVTKMSRSHEQRTCVMKFSLQLTATHCKAKHCITGGKKDPSRVYCESQISGMLHCLALSCTVLHCLVVCGNWHVQYVEQVPSKPGKPCIVKRRIKLCPPLRAWCRQCVVHQTHIHNATDERNTLQHTAAHCGTHTHCNTLQHTRQCIARHAHTHHTQKFIAPRFQTSLGTLPRACKHTDKLIRRYTYKVVKRDRERGSEKERARERERERESEREKARERTRERERERERNLLGCVVNAIER